MALVCPSPIEDLSLYSCLRPRRDPYRWESAALEDTQCTVCRSNERSVDHLRCGHWVCSSCTLQEQSRSAGVQCPVCGEEMFRSKLRRTSVAKGGRASSFFPRLVPFVTEKIPPKESSGSRNIPLRTETPAPARGDPPQEEMSEMDTSEGTVEVQCSFPVSGVQPLDWKEFTPEKSTDSRKISFRFRCPGSGAFRCSSTGLVFVVTKEAELQYRPVQWDEALLQSSGRTPAGPLYDIECPERALCELHLPHCEPEHVGVSERRLAVAHITDSRVTFIEPLRITKSHVVIEVQGLSVFGLVWKVLDWVYHRCVSGQVLLFLGAQNPKTKRRRMNVLLLPTNVSVDEVHHKQPKMRNVQVPAFCNFTVKQNYSVECSEAFKVQPKKAMFFLDFGPNFHPTFEIRLTAETEMLNLTIRDEKQTEVWQHEVDLTDVTSEEIQRAAEGSCSSSWIHTESDATLKNWLSSVRPDFIRRVSEPVLNQVLDLLLASGVLTAAEREHAGSKGRPDRAAFVLDSAQKKGAKARNLFLRDLCEVDPCLFQDLRTIAGPPLSPALVRLTM